MDQYPVFGMLRS